MCMRSACAAWTIILSSIGGIRERVLEKEIEPGSAGEKVYGEADSRVEKRGQFAKARGEEDPDAFEEQEDEVVSQSKEESEEGGAEE
ncbi:hypothetical protein L7F22_057078, partial [Adiantum nelumboides]|nr:hypothetical protein [Adiantum nelumboides]